MRIKKLVEDITFHHVGPLGFHLLPGVPSSIITKIKAIWLSARHPPTLVVFQLPCMGNFTHESEERYQRALHHLSHRPLLQLEELGSETGLPRPLSQQQPLPPAQHSNLAKCFHSTVYLIFPG